MATHTPRALSPLIGTVLLIAITLLLAATLAAFALATPALSVPDFTDGPEADFEITETRSYTLVEHVGGDALEASHVTIGGETWGESGTIEDGDTTTVAEAGDIVWSDGSERVVLERVEN